MKSSLQVFLFCGILAQEYATRNTTDFIVIDFSWLSSGIFESSDLLRLDLWAVKCIASSPPPENCDLAKHNFCAV